MAELTDRERLVLAFEQGWAPTGGRGAKVDAIREAFGWTETRYYQALNALLDDERALAHSPLLVHRLRRMRQARRRR